VVGGASVGVCRAICGPTRAFTVARSPRTTAAATVSASVSVALSAPLTSSLACVTAPPGPCCTVCVSSWAMRRWPDSLDGWYCPAAKWMSRPTVYASEDRRLALDAAPASV